MPSMWCATPLFHWMLTYNETQEIEANYSKVNKTQLARVGRTLLTPFQTRLCATLHTVNVLAQSTMLRLLQACSIWGKDHSSKWEIIGYYHYGNAHCATVPITTCTSEVTFPSITLLLFPAFPLSLLWIFSKESPPSVNLLDKLLEGSVKTLGPMPN